MTRFRGDRYDPARSRRSPISRVAGDEGQAKAELERLERAVAALVERHATLVRENVELRAACDERARRIRELEDQALELHQRRQDVAKRIDDLIAQIDHIETQLPAAGLG